jgi:DNA-binding NarL/FixJ family response regulator
VIRVVLADDHHVVRQGLRVLLEKAGDLEVVGEAADGQAAVEMVERLGPDVLVMDIAMPRLDGLQALARLRAAGVLTPVVILSMYSEAPMIKQALRLGARGYLLKRSMGDELLLAIRAAHQGELFLSPAISAAIVENFLDQGDSADNFFDLLSAREREVLQLIVEGYTTNAIAELLHVSVKTIEKQRASLMSKLGVHDLASLIRTALKHNLVSLDE